MNTTHAHGLTAEELIALHAINAEMQNLEEITWAAQEAARNAENKFKEGRDALREKARSFLEKMTVADAVALIPEDVRPTLIEVEEHPVKGRVLILRLKIAPKYAFIIWEEVDHSGRFSLDLKSGLSHCRRHLVCFCENGCMQHEEKKRLLASLAKTCVQHGISTLLGRNICEEKGGVQFFEGDHYEGVLRNHPDKKELERSNSFLSLLTNGV